MYNSEDQTSGSYDPSHTSGKELSEAIESLPEILNRKANLEAHTNILQAVMKKIASREVPTYFEVEQSILNAGRMVDKSAVISLLKDSSKGKLYDKARLLLLVVVSGDANVNSKLVSEEYDQAFIAGCQGLPESNAGDATSVKEEIDNVLSAAAFLRRLQSLQSPIQQRFGGNSSQSSTSNAIISSLLNTAQSKATSLMAKATSFFTKFNPMFITRIVDLLSDGKACVEDETYTYFDTTMAITSNSSNPNAAETVRLGMKYSEVIVFVVGGGCYSEYFNLQELLKVKQQSASSANSTSIGLRNIIYGSSELTSGDKFLKQVEKLASMSSTK